ncbi:uncharacterized protein LOC115950255 [Quercus lobata]|uniref:uncharacterized protein LOC115950255 n=1 Tax=Quercus lobata TaxID=97700 RepID=UPI0012487494|nr:uncharacterized protein LOC115950255 [Quercus lobata]
MEDEGNLGLSEEGFGAFDNADPSEDPSGDLGDPDLSEAKLLSVGTSSRAEMGIKRKPPTSLFDLIEGQPGKGAQGKPQSNAPSPPPQPQPVQTRSSSTKSQPQSPRPKLPAPPQSALPPRLEPADLKRKRSPKGKEPIDGGKSQSSHVRDEAPRAQKQLKIGHQSKGKWIEAQSAQIKGKGIEAQSAPSAWLPAPLLHGEPLLENASMRDLGDGDGGYMADALGTTMLLPTDMEELKNMRMQEVFLSAKRCLGMAIQATYRMEEEVKGQSKAAEAEEQTKCLLAAEDQLQIAKEQISDLKKQLIEANNAKGVAEFAKDVAEFAKDEAAESIFYPPAIRETTSASSEATSDPHKAGAAQSKVAQIIVPPGESTEGREPYDATEAPRGLNPEMPKEGAEPTVNAQIYGAEEPAIFVQPLQAIPLTDVSKSVETDPA